MSEEINIMGHFLVPIHEVKIERESPTAGVSVVYRRVMELVK